MSIAIRVEGLSKRYTIAAMRHRHDTLRDQIAESFKALYRHGDGSKSRVDNIWALRDISFEVKTGEIVGLIGRNGAGKSTLLKLLSRITEPTKGRAEIYGRVGSLLEVGTGFDRELTGRENIYLSGAILGMKKAEIERKFDDIVAFAEIEKFVETPVKRYSSGMYLRLAFAVAAHLDPEILLLDEVLAVGDAAFQKRCLGKMEEVANRGRTILFVSHNLAAITRFCTRCIWVDAGQIRADGHPEGIVAEYLASGVRDCGEVRFAEHEAPGSEYVQLSAVRVRDSSAAVAATVDARRPFTIEVEYRVLRYSGALRVGITLLSADGSALLSSKDIDASEGDLARGPGQYVSRCRIPGDFLNYGQYFVSVGADFPMIQSHFFADRTLSFQVERTGGVGGHIADNRSGMLRMRLPWDIDQVA
jgi:homopolymeric O-antigen transport system ATP-binding protein